MISAAAATPATTICRYRQSAKTYMYYNRLTHVKLWNRLHARCVRRLKAWHRAHTQTHTHKLLCYRWCYSIWTITVRPPQPPSHFDTSQNVTPETPIARFIYVYPHAGVRVCVHVFHSHQNDVHMNRRIQNPGITQIAWTIHIDIIKFHYTKPPSTSHI